MHSSSGLCKKYLSDFSFALRCVFWVWLPSLSGRLAVDADTCSSAFLYAHSTIPGFVSRHGPHAKTDYSEADPVLHSRASFGNSSNCPCKNYRSDSCFALRCVFLGMAPFAVRPSRSRYNDLLVGLPLCSFHHTGFCLTAKTKQLHQRV